ncbi:MAG TPA: hypothetical protein VGM97_06430 [Steroidobacteraceae bacterium]|jgi:hypothetical protein
MNADEKQAKMEAIRRHIAKMESVRQHMQRTNEAWLLWSDKAAASAVEELLLGKLIRPDQASFVQKIIAQDLRDSSKGSIYRALSSLHSHRAE